MLDIKFVRENPEIVKQNIRNKFQDSKLELVDKVIELDKENREIKQEVEALRWDRENAKKQKKLRNRLLHLEQESMSFLQEKKK